MRKKIFKTLLCSLVIAIAALFAGSEVIAFCDNCDPGELPISVVIGPYTVTLNSIEQIVDSTPTYYKWKYTVVNTGTTALTGLNFLAMLIPDCCNGTIAVDVDNYQKYFGVAVGEDTLNFGRYNQQASVIKIFPDSLTNWVIVATSNTPTITTALIRYGQGHGDAISAEIPGPGCAKVQCPAPATRVEPRSQCWQFIAEEDQCETDTTWYAEWTEGDECAVRVWACSGIIACDRGTIISNTDPNNPNAICRELDPQALSDITSGGEILTALLTSNSQCSEVWARFVDQNTGCNIRCYVSGGKKYCF